MPLMFALLLLDVIVAMCYRRVVCVVDVKPQHSAWSTWTLECAYVNRHVNVSPVEDAVGWCAE